MNKLKSFSVLCLPQHHIYLITLLLGISKFYKNITVYITTTIHVKKFIQSTPFKYNLNIIWLTEDMNWTGFA